jgi:hypothetical protein
MTVLEIHNNECFKVAKGILKTNIETPILAKLDSSNGVNYIIFIDGEKLAENLELKVKSSLKKSDLSDKYLLELDFDNPYIQNESLYFEKIIESAVFYEVPESISETKEDLNWFKKVIYEDGYSKEYSREELLKEFGIVEVNPKLGLEFLDLAITSSMEVETVFQRRTTEVEVGRIQQYILPHERGFELPSEFLNYYLIKQFERKQPVQILSTKTTTITKMLSHGYTSNNFIVKILLECILKKVENTIEYQTIADLTEEQYSFVNWAKGIVETVDKYIRCFSKLYYTEEELKELANISTDKIEIVYLIEFNGIFKCLVKAEHLQKILADGSLLGQKEDIELKETSTGLEVKDTDIEHLEQSYSALTINAVPLYY